MKKANTPIPLIIGISSLLCLLIHPLTPAIQADNTPANLWKVDTDKGSVYLSGSIHFGDKDLIASIPQSVLDAFDKSKVFVVELDVNYSAFTKRNLWKILFSFSCLLTPVSIYCLRKIAAKKDKSFKQLIPRLIPCLIPLWVVLSITFSYLYIVGMANTILQKGDFATIRRACRSLDMSWFATLRQTYIMLTVSACIGGREGAARYLLGLPLIAIFSSPSPYFGVEQFFKRRMCQDESKVIEELETLQTQLEAIAKIRSKEKSLSEIASQLPQVKKAMQELRNGWEAGDLEKLEAVNRYWETFYEDNYANDLLISRNHQMVDTIIQRYLQTPTDSSSANPLYDGDIFITVGILHFPGKEGIIALLREKGYTVHQLTRDGSIYVPPAK